MASLLVPREIHFVGPSGRIWRGDPFIEEHGDATVEVMIQVGCEPTHMDTSLGHHIHEWVGEYSMEQWSADGHGDAWGSVIVCCTTLWRGIASHHIEYMQGVIGAVTQDGTRWYSHSREYLVVYRDRLWHTLACGGVQQYWVVCSGR